MQKQVLFWDAVSPSEHFVQIYDHEDVLLESLEAYVSAGLLAGDSVIAILTESHRKALDARLYAHSSSLVDSLDRLISFDAEKTMSRFIVGDWPDEDLFREVVGEMLEGVKDKGRRVWLFGEGVAVLWAQGHRDAAIHVEQLWNKVLESEDLTVFCAYPRSIFTLDAFPYVKQMCACHSKVVDRLIVT